MLGHLTSPGTAWPGSAGWWEVAGPFERCPVPCPALSLSLWSPQLSTLTRPETSTLRGQCSVLAVFNGNLPRPEKSFRGHPWTSGSMLGPQDTAAERQSRAETEWGLSTSRGGEGEGGRKRKRGGKERREEERKGGVRKEREEGWGGTRQSRLLSLGRCPSLLVEGPRVDVPVELLRCHPGEPLARSELTPKDRATSPEHCGPTTRPNHWPT